MRPLIYAAIFGGLFVLIVGGTLLGAHHVDVLKDRCRQADGVWEGGTCFRRSAVIEVEQ